MDKRSFAVKSDLIIILVIGLAAFAVFMLLGRGKETGYAEIVYNNEVIGRLDLTEDGIYSPEGFDVTFEVRDGAAAFVSSDCPDKICVNTGFISRQGQSAVCLPNRLTLRIAGGEAGADVYTG